MRCSGSNLGYIARRTMLGDRLRLGLINAGGLGVVDGGEERRTG